MKSLLAVAFPLVGVVLIILAMVSCFLANTRGPAVEMAMLAAALGVVAIACFNAAKFFVDEGK